MLREITAVRQDSSAVTRRWFQDDYFDLFVWVDSEGQLERFQLCYDRQHAERVLVWNGDNRFLHQRVDSGEATPMRNDAPLFEDDAIFEMAQVMDQFDQRAGSMPDDLRHEIRNKMRCASVYLRDMAG